MNIAFTVSDNYIDYMGTTLLSILKHNKEEAITVYLLTTAISPYSLFKLKRLEKDYEQLTIKVRVVDASQFDNLPLNRSHITRPEVYFRMAFPSLLPEVDKILYLDSDLLVKKDLTTLWHTDLEGNYMAAVSEPPSEGGFDYRKSIGMRQPELYFNSGVLLMDLKKMRNDGIEKRLLACGQEIKDKILLQDQDIINVALEGQIKPIDIIYNYGYMERQANLRSDDELVIIHFSLEKPWDTSLDVPEYNRQAVNDYLAHYQTYRSMIEPLISVIVPLTGNTQELKKTLSSIAEQTYKNIDCLLLDFGTSDSYQEILAAYRPHLPALRIYRFDPEDSSRTLELGFKLAMGDYLTTIVANDWVDKDYLATLYRLLMEEQATTSLCLASFFNWEDQIFRFYPEVSLSDNQPTGRNYLQALADSNLINLPYYQSSAGILLSRRHYGTHESAIAQLPDKLAIRSLLLLSQKLAVSKDCLYISSQTNSEQAYDSEELVRYFQQLQTYLALEKQIAPSNNRFYRSELERLSQQAKRSKHPLNQTIEQHLKKLDFIEGIRN